MKNIYNCIASFLLLIFLGCIPVGVQAQFLSAPPVGAVWTYQNEGQDTSVRYIKVVQHDTIAYYEPLKDSLRVTFQRIYHIGGDGSERFSGIHVISHTGPRNTQLMVSVGEWPPQNYYLLYDLTVQDSGSMPITLVSDTSLRGRGLALVDSTSYITVNGKRLLIKYLNPIFPKTPQSPDPQCIYFCSPLIERIGSLGYMVPTNTCADDTIYAGRLLKYYDPEIGEFIVPDSLRNQACQLNIATSVREEFGPGEAGVSLYPNPAHEQFTLRLPVPASVPTVFTVYDLYGRALVQGTLYTGMQELKLDISHIPAGMYLVKSQAGSTVRLMKR